MFRLTHSSLDDKVEVSDHDTREAAIEAAVTWFRDGYDDAPDYLPEDVAQLREDLAAGREFYCSNFYERVTVEEVGVAADPG